MKTLQRYQPTTNVLEKGINRINHPFTALDLQFEGKSKKVWTLPDLPYVAIENTDRLTAYNGRNTTLVSNKGKYFARTSVNCFRLLRRYGVPNHLLPLAGVDRSNGTFWASKLRMIPVEFVIRHRAYGSYIKRHPDVRAKEIFPEPVIEFFEKDDDMDDPHLVIDHSREVVSRYKPDEPQGPSSLIDERPLRDVDYLMPEYWPMAASIARDAAIILREAWAKSGAALVDIKFECGIDADNHVLIGDSIDADCWRLWRNNDSSNPLDRQLFKNGCTPMQILEAYKFTLQQTELWNSANADRRGLL